MADFVNTIDIIGDEALTNSIIEKTVIEYFDNTITNIGAYAFYGCTSLESVDFPNATSVNDNAFYYCTALKSVSLPAVTDIFKYAFHNCSSLISVDFPNTENVSKYMGTYMFENCTSLESVNLPKATGIGGSMFKGCSKLQSVNIPNATLIGSKAFYGCTSLKELDFYAITNIDNDAFKNCSALTALLLRNTSNTPALNSDSVFSSTPIKNGTGYIYVPYALVDSYKSATNWSTYASQIRALEGYTVDGTTTGALDHTKI